MFLMEYVLNGIKCDPVCDKTCQTCSTPKTLDACLSCPAEKYLSGNNCLSCVSPCKSCTKGDTNSCKDCIQNY